MDDTAWEAERLILLAAAQAAIIALYEHMGEPSGMNIPLDKDLGYGFVRRDIPLANS